MLFLFFSKTLKVFHLWPLLFLEEIPFLPVSGSLTQSGSFFCTVSSCLFRTNQIKSVFMEHQGQCLDFCWQKRGRQRQWLCKTRYSPAWIKPQCWGRLYLDATNFSFKNQDERRLKRKWEDFFLRTAFLWVGPVLLKDGGNLIRMFFTLLVSPSADLYLSFSHK